ncbi:hypothetical protein ANO11243_024660 [Dothideomycetidae sp. 11243]|nr:hypothetical protein ANO11243_024660 [fungal sp. No.11243]
MKSSIALVAAVSAPLAAATLLTSSSGGAMIINKCDQPIPMQNVPAMGSGVENGEECDKTLAANNVGADSQYFTPWIALQVPGGWSMKLNTMGNWNNIMQFEYTWTGDKELWYDMSFVNGVESDHPSWQFEYNGQVTTNAYTFATDDAQGMQAPVPVDATVTLVLCPQSTGAGAAAPTSTAAATSPAAPAYTPSSSSTTLATSTTVAAGGKNVYTTPSASPSPAPTTTTTTADDFDIVTEYQTEIVTAYAVVTEVASAHAKAKRHEHRHPHGHVF